MVLWTKTISHLETMRNHWLEITGESTQISANASFASLMPVRINIAVASSALKGSARFLELSPFLLVLVWPPSGNHSNWTGSFGFGDTPVVRGASPTVPSEARLWAEESLRVATPKARLDASFCIQRISVCKPHGRFGAVCLDVRTFNFLPTNRFPIKPLKVKLFAGEQKATEVAHQLFFMFCFVLFVPPPAGKVT